MEELATARGGNEELRFPSVSTALLSLAVSILALALFDAVRASIASRSVSPLGLASFSLFAVRDSLCVLGPLVAASAAAAAFAWIGRRFHRLRTAAFWLEIATSLVAVLLCYSKLAEYRKLAGYAPLIALHGGVLALLVGRTWLRERFGAPTGTAGFWRRNGMRVLPGAMIAFSIVLLVANYELHYDTYPTLHTSVAMLAFLLLQSGLVIPSAAFARRARGQAPALAALAVLGVPLISSVPLSRLSPVQEFHPRFARFSILGQEIARGAWEKENMQPSAPGQGAFDPDGVARFAKQSGLPSLPDGFDLLDYNILLVSMESTRVDETSLIDSTRNPTPRLLDYAKSGAHWFTRAYSGSAYTVQSMAGIFTMAYPSATGLRIYEARWSGYLDAKYPTVPEYLDEAGYDTFAVVYTGGASEEAQLNWVRPRFSNIQTLTETKILGAAKRALSLRAKDNKRFFGWVFFSSPHSPYLARFEDMPSKTDRDRYRQDIRYADSDVGELLSHLERLGLDKNTIVIIHADHGEAFAEHGKKGHQSLYSECTRVPLIVKIPGVAGKKSETPTSLLYVFPWLFSRGSEELRAVARHRMERVFGPALEATDGAVVSEIFSSIGTGALLVNGTRHFHHDFASNHNELYDIATDPAEKKDIFESDTSSSRASLARFERYAVVRKKNLNVTFDSGNADALETEEDKRERIAEQKKMRAAGEAGYAEALKKSRHWKVQYEAMQRLCESPSLKTESIDALVETLVHRSQELRKHLTRRLAKATAPGIDERLLHAMRADSPLNGLSYTFGEGERRTMSQAAASMLKKRKDKALPSIVAALGTDDPALLSYASRAIGGFGAKAMSAVPRLQALSRHPDSGIRETAQKSLKRITGEP